MPPGMMFLSKIITGIVFVAILYFFVFIFAIKSIFHKQLLHTQFIQGCIEAIIFMQSSPGKTSW